MGRRRGGGGARPPPEVKVTPGPRCTWTAALGNPKLRARGRGLRGRVVPGARARPSPSRRQGPRRARVSGRREGSVSAAAAGRARFQAGLSAPPPRPRVTRPRSRREGVSVPGPEGARPPAARAGRAARGGARAGRGVGWAGRARSRGCQRTPTGPLSSTSITSGPRARLPRRAIIYPHTGTGG